MMMAQQPTVMPQEMMPQPHPHPQAMHPPVNSYYPENPNDLTGGLPINLDSLRDGPPGSKPFYPYSTLIRYAIKGAPNQKLLLEDIYYAIESRFPYFRSAPPGWKNSVRHNLSLNPCFEKVPRPLTDRGKGSYWTVNDNVDPRTGVHRVRKKKSKGSKGQQSQQQQQQQQQPPQQATIESDVDYHPAPDPSFHDPNAQYVQPQSMGPDAAGPSRQATYPPPYPSPYVATPPDTMPCLSDPLQTPARFDPGFTMIPPAGMRYVPPPLFGPEEALETDEHGNINWHGIWRKELTNLAQITEEQEKAGADQEWFRMMLFRVRTALMAPPMAPGEGVVHVQGGPPHGIPGQPPNPGEE